MPWRGSLSLGLLLMLSGCMFNQSDSTENRIAQADDIPLSPAQLQQHVRVLAEQYPGRNFFDLRQLNGAADYIRQQWQAMGLVVTTQSYEVEDDRAHNLSVHLGPDTGPKFVIGAHYDVAADGPGADDNASGVAGLLELTRLLQGQMLTKGVTLVAYSLEEPPYYRTDLMGSYQHAKAEHAAGADIELMISLEMIGYFSDEPGSQRYPLDALTWFYPDTGNFIAVIDQFWSNWGREASHGMSRYMQVPVYYLSAPASIVGVDFSDHRSYWAFDYDAVMVTDTAFFRNQSYHQTSDTADTLDYPRMAEVVIGVYGYVLELAK